MAVLKNILTISNTVKSIPLMNNKNTVNFPEVVKLYLKFGLNNIFKKSLLGLPIDDGYYHPTSSVWARFVLPLLSLY